MIDPRSKVWPGPTRTSRGTGLPVHQLLGTVADLAQVVGRDLGGHADRDAVGAVDQQVRHPRRHDRGHLPRAVVVGDEVDGFLVEVLHDLGGELGQTRLGIPLGRGRVAVDAAEVALAVHERVAEREVLGHAHHGAVDRGRAVRMVVAARVTGDLGAAYLGLQVLERERQVFEANPNAQHELDNYTYLVERQLKPEARKDVVRLFGDLGLVPTSMIDISDGLSSEVLHLCKESNAGCSVYEDKIPLDQQVISTCEEFNLDSTTIALSGGEDYELLFTVPPSREEALRAVLPALDCEVTRIGRIESDPGLRFVDETGIMRRPGHAWDHFADED